MSPEKADDARAEDASSPRAASVSGLRTVAVGSAWTIGARWGARCIGLVSTIILARILQPQDFGLIAMGALTLQFVLVFADAGQSLAVIRNVDASREHFDTAWTMSVGVGTIVGLVLVLIAPLSGWYFHEPRVVPLIQFLALKPFINGFTNVGLLHFRRDFRFDKDFQFLVAQKLSVFVVVVALAWLLRSYWALAIGNVCGEVLNVALSYAMHPYRPRLRLSKLREMLSYSTWMQVASIGVYVGDQADQLLVGGMLGSSAMGAYNVAADLAGTPTNELVIPAARALFPYYATLLSEPKRFAEVYLRVLSAVAVIGLSTGVGVALVSSDLVALVLGPKWQAAAPLMGWLAIGSGVLGVARSATTILTVTGSSKLFALRNWCFVLVLVPAVMIGGRGWGIEGIAAARMAAVVVFAPAMFYATMQVLPISFAEVAAKIWRPAVAAICMAVVVELAGTESIGVLPLRLLCNVGLGAATFAASLLGVWYATGRGPGVERTAVDQAWRMWQHLRQHREVLPN